MSYERRVFLMTTARDHLLTSQVRPENLSTMAGEWEQVDRNMVRHNGSGGLYLRAKVGGKIIRKALGTKAIRIGKAKRDSLLKELREKSGINSKGQAEKLSKDAALDRAWEYYQGLPKYQEKPANLDYRKQTIAVLRESLPDSPPSSWTAEVIRKWWSDPRVTRYSPTRRNGTLDTLRQVLDLLIERGDLKDDPTRKLQRVSIPQSEIVVPSRDEFQTLVADVRSQNKRVSTESADMIEFLAYSGCRIGEAREILWSQVGKQFIRVTGGQKKTKNSQSRNVPIIPMMKSLLDSMRSRNDSGPLFFLHSPRFAIRNSCERLGLPHYTPHTMRHLFATTCIESGIDIPTVAKWLGHSDGGALAMKTYGHLRDDHSLKQAKRVEF